MIAHLKDTADRQDIIENLNLFKIHALNLLTDAISNGNAQHLEPNELKTLVTTGLSLEASLDRNLLVDEEDEPLIELIEKYRKDMEGDNLYTLPPKYIDA